MMRKLLIFAAAGAVMVLTVIVEGFLGARTAEAQRSPVPLPVAQARPEGTSASQTVYPVQKAQIIGLPQSHMSVSAPMYTVPDGFRLAIDYVSFALTAPAHDDNAVVRLRIGATLGGEIVWHDVDTLSGSRNWTGASQLVKIYADPKTAVFALVERQFSPASTARVSFAGHLEPMPRKPAVQKVRLLPTLFAPRSNMGRHLAARQVYPFDVEQSRIAEQLAPSRIRNRHLDPELASLVVEPFADVGYAGEDHGKPKANEVFVESLLTRTNPKASVRRDAQVQIDREMLMRPQIVHDAVSRGAVDHVGVEAAGALCLECANPRHRFATE